MFPDVSGQLYLRQHLLRSRGFLGFLAFERDRVEIRDAATLLPPTLNRGTIEMWFKPDSVITANTHPPDWTYLFAKNLSGNSAGDGDLETHQGLNCSLLRGL